MKKDKFSVKHYIKEYNEKREFFFVSKVCFCFEQRAICESRNIFSRNMLGQISRKMPRKRPMYRRNLPFL